MADWSDNITAIAAAITDPSAFGEPITLPSGAIVSGVYEYIPSPAAPWPETGAPLRLSDQGNHAFYLRPAAVVGLARNNRLEYQGHGWLIVDIDPPESGLVLVTVRRAPLADPGGSRWQ